MWDVFLGVLLALLVMLLLRVLIGLVTYPVHLKTQPQTRGRCGSGRPAIRNGSPSLAPR